MVVNKTVKLVRVDIDCMFDINIDVFTCPACKSSGILTSKWSCEHFTNFKCRCCGTDIFFIDNNCNLNEYPFTSDLISMGE